MASPSLERAMKELTSLREHNKEMGIPLTHLGPQYSGSGADVETRIIINPESAWVVTN